jgi:hypothetical protein
MICVSLPFLDIHLYSLFKSRPKQNVTARCSTSRLLVHSTFPTCSVPSIFAGPDRLVVGIGLGQILLQESQVLLSTGRALTGVSGDVLGSGSGGGSESGLSSVEFGELGGEVGGQGRGLGGSRGGVRLDDSNVSVLGLQEKSRRVSV